MEKMEFETGELGEGYPWNILFDEPIRLGSVKPCRHCLPVRTETCTRTDGSTYEEKWTTCPRVVAAYNEGYNNSTCVCLDCILEAARELEERRGRYD
jgi:hypothetical protein